MSSRVFSRAVASVSLIGAAGLLLGGCPPGSGPGPNLNGPKATITNIEIEKNGFIAAGDGIIAYGKISGGVSWLNVATGAKTNIPGSFVTDAIYCSGRKIVLVADGAARSVSIHDTTTGTTAAVPDTDVFDISPGGYLENQYIAVDGNFCAILHRLVAGIQLKVIDFSAATPTVKAYTTTLVNPHNVDIDGTTGQIVVMEDNQFISIFSTAAAANDPPTTYDLMTDANVSIDYFPNTRIHNGFVILPDFDTHAAHLVKVADGTLSTPAENPTGGTGLSQFAIRGGAFMYFLGRTGAGDSDSSNGARSAIGFVSAPTTITTGPGANLGGGILSGFGISQAIAPDGSAAYLAGRFSPSAGDGIDDPTALQGNFGQGWALITDSSGNSIPAADVNASTNVVAFKVENGASAVLGYYQP